MQDKEWNEGIWDTSWDNLFCGNKYVQGHCEFLSTVGAVLTIPFGDISESRISATNGIYLFTAEEKRYPYLYGVLLRTELASLYWMPYQMVSHAGYLAGARRGSVRLLY